MDRAEAIRILDPETTAESLTEIEYYNGFSGRTAVVQAVYDAIDIAVADMRAQEQSQWISVKERLPESFVDVLVYRDGKISIDYHEENGWFAYDFKGKRATHWMPLPEPPKEGADHE